MTTYDIITIIISAVSLALSIGHIANEIWNRRTKIKIQIDETAFETLRYFAVFPDVNKITVPCSFINQSHSDISIVRITAVLKDGRKCTAYIQEHFVMHNFWKSPDTGKFIEKLFYTVRFPINLVSLQGDYGILCFKLPKQDDYKFTDVIVETNKSTVHLEKFASLLTEFTRDARNRNDERNHSDDTCDNLTVG